MLAIARLSSRLAGPDAEAVFAATPLLDDATRRLPRSLDGLLPSALAAAGLPAQAVVGLRRLDVRLRLDDTADSETVAGHWAAAIMAALTEALPGASRYDTAATAARSTGRSTRPGAAAGPDAATLPVGATSPNAAAADSLGAIDADGPAARDDADVVVFADLWRAEAALLRRIAAGLPAPWWEDVVGSPPPDVHAIIAGWIERDPARAAVALLDLLRSAPAFSALLSPRAADRLAAALFRRLRSALPAASGAGARRDEAMPPEAMPPALRGALAAIAPERRAPFLLAALVVHLPAWTIGFSGSESGLAALAGQPPAQRNPGADAMPAPDGGTEPAREATAGVAVLQGGLLLLMRPYAESELLDGLRGERLTKALLALGLAALRRTAASLSPAARRLTLERDRPLLEVFAGRAPPEAPLDTLIVPPEAERHLDAILAFAPAGVDWAPGALRACFGGVDPFGDTADGRLARILLRPARLVRTPWSADLTWPPASADIVLRRAGWDIDPGWLPWIGRVVRFHFDGPDVP